VKDKILICGPCSAESQEQVLQTAFALSKRIELTYFRAGVWKPRTRPGSFEGAGITALKWLQEVSNQTGINVITEVATPDHVKAILKYGFKAVWIGARTTSNPFSVQEIADELRGTNIEVFVKNPVNPDIELWQGALERFIKAGTNRIHAIHRGFYPFEKTKLRNIPKWEIPIELKRRMPDIKVICDPSHIAGSIDFIEEIAQKAMDLNMDGLMIESHIDPENALSDSKQQLEPRALSDMLNNLVVRCEKFENEVFIKQIEQLRDQIDSIDQQMIELLSQRMGIVEEIGKYKQENNVSILQLRRWQQIIESRIEQGQKLGLSEDFIRKLLTFVHKESITCQSEIFKNNKD